MLIVLELSHFKHIKAVRLILKHYLVAIAPDPEPDNDPNLELEFKEQSHPNKINHLLKKNIKKSKYLS